MKADADLRGRCKIRVAQGLANASSVLSDGFARYECIILAAAKHNVWESFVLAEGSTIDFPSLAPMFVGRLVHTD